MSLADRFDFRDAVYPFISGWHKSYNSEIPMSSYFSSHGYSEFPVQLLTRFSIKVKMSGHFKCSPVSSSIEFRIHVLGTDWIVSKKEHTCVDYKATGMSLLITFRKTLKTQYIPRFLASIQSRILCTVYICTYPFLET
jgi:hypothetical protein